MVDVSTNGKRDRREGGTSHHADRDEKNVVMVMQVSEWQHFFYSVEH